MVRLRMLRKRERNSFLSEEDGAATIEAVLWLPVFFFIVGFATDVTMIFHAHSRVLRVVQDVNRAVSVGRIDTIDEAKQKMLDMLPGYANATSKMQIEDGVIMSIVTVPTASIMPLGVAKALVGHMIVVRTEQYAEQ
jgi:Flp pilus assembly protein TadG